MKASVPGRSNCAQPRRCKVSVAHLTQSGRNGTTQVVGSAPISRSWRPYLIPTAASARSAKVNKRRIATIFCYPDAATPPGRVGHYYDI